MGKKSQETWIEIARPGRFQDSGWAWHEFTTGRLGDMALRYYQRLRGGKVADAVGKNAISGQSLRHNAFQHGLPEGTESRPSRPGRSGSNRRRLSEPLGELSAAFTEPRGQGAEPLLRVGSGAWGESPLPRRGPGRGPGEPEWEAMERAVKQYAPKAAAAGHDALRFIRLLREPNRGEIGGLGVFHLLPGIGWQGSTVFSPGNPNRRETMLSYLEKQRAGLLLYREK